MDIKKAKVLYLSGTGTTEKYAKAFAKGLGCETEVEPINVQGSYGGTMGTGELLVLAAPVFGGYAPHFVWEQLEGLTGTDTPAVILAVYGARDYDNALLEMSSKLADKGFATVGAAALVARHSIVQTIAPGRPNDADLEGVCAFAKTVAQRLDDMGSIADVPSFTFKGELADTANPGMVPQVSDACVQCGTCARECPAGAIPEDAPNTVDADKCISCLHCIEVCPMNARTLPEQMVAGAAQMLSTCTDPEKANEYF